MTTVVLDASVVGKWFKDADEDNLVEARALFARFQSGDLNVSIPSWLPLELVNPAVRSWRWPEAAVRRMVTRLLDLPWDWRDPDLLAVVEWTHRGLTAYDAVYVALAESLGAPLITADREILLVAGSLAEPLAAT